MIYLANAFSLQMLNSDDCTVRVRTVDPETVTAALEVLSWQSCVGHADTAAVFSAELAGRRNHSA